MTLQDEYADAIRRQQIAHDTNQPGGVKRMADAEVARVARLLKEQQA